MQRNYFLVGLLASLLLLCTRASLAAQDAAAVAEREEREANYKRMLLKVEGIEEALQAQTKRMSALTSEINALREDVDRLKSRNESAATQEGFKRLAEKIEEVDKKRRADSDLVYKQINDLRKGVSRIATDPVVSAPAKPPKPSEGAAAPDKPGYTYQIKDGDTLSRIVKELTAQNYKITQKQMMDANPTVNWSKLRIGQTVIVPSPAP